MGKKTFPKNKKPTSEWNVIVVNSRKFIKKYHVKWIDMGKEDWVNNEIWKTVWSKPISRDIKDKLLYYSQLISDNYKNLGNFSKEVKEFESFVLKETAKYL